MKLPRNIHNFWIATEVNGQRTKVAAGSPLKKGGFTTIIFMRSNKDIISPIKIIGTSDGINLDISIRMNHKEVCGYKTKR